MADGMQHIAREVFRHEFPFRGYTPFLRRANQFRACVSSVPRTELLGSPQKWIVPSNWKFVSENFAGDMLHAVSHRSVEMVGIGPGEAKSRRDHPGERFLSAYPQGHGFLYGIKSAKEARDDYSNSPFTASYFQECWQRRVKRMGDRAGVIPIL